MRHVFVETNWLVGYAAPAHLKINAAVDLLKKASEGELQLYLPSICLTECRRPIREKFQARGDADRVRKFLLWAKQRNIIETQADETVRLVLDRMESLVHRDLDRLDQSLSDLRGQKGVEVFSLNEEMLDRCVSLSHLGLQPFDQAILASILVKAEMLKKGGIPHFAFCEADSDLQPWDRRGDPKESLVALYEQAAIWVYRDFLLEEPEMPESFPHFHAASPNAGSP